MPSVRVAKFSQMGSELNDILHKFDVKIRKSHNAKLNKALTEIWGSIIEDTPVDKGGARGGWVVSSSPAGTVQRRSKNKGKNYVRRKLPRNLLEMRRKLYLSNNLPYINVLEFGGYAKNETKKVTSRGFSKKAPNGMVRKNLLRWKHELSKVFR